MSIQEQPEIPAVCDNCLGPNPYIEMLRDYNGAECRLCTRPFTVFEWNSKKGEKRKKTLICLTCARAKNCCQVCILDLTYGLDLHLRDSVLKMAGEEIDEDDNAPTNALTKAYKADRLDAEYSKGLIKNDLEVDENRSEKARDLLMKVAASQQQQQQQQRKQKPQEMKSKEIPLSKADLQKLISKLPFNGSLQPKSIEKGLKSFFIFGITDELPDYLISNYFETRFKTTIQSMSIIHNARAGFINFKNAETASNIATTMLQDFLIERNAQTTTEYNRPVPLVIELVPLRVCWGKPKSLGQSNSEHYKIAAVVKKQMKLLADKDIKEFGKSSSA